MSHVFPMARSTAVINRTRGSPGCNSRIRKPYYVGTKSEPPSMLRKMPKLGTHKPSPLFCSIMLTKFLAKLLQVCYCIMTAGGTEIAAVPRPPPTPRALQWARSPGRKQKSKIQQMCLEFFVSKVCLIRYSPTFLEELLPKFSLKNASTEGALWHHRLQKSCHGTTAVLLRSALSPICIRSPHGERAGVNLSPLPMARELLGGISIA